MIESRVKSVFSTMIRASPGRVGRPFAVWGLVITVLGVNLISVTAANADSFWTRAIEIPGLATLNRTVAAPGQFVCTSSGNCVSGGSFTDGSQSQQAFLSQESDGVWSSATVIARALNVGGSAQIMAISCPAAGSCTAVGFYSDVAEARHTFVISQVNGTWGYPTEVPDFTSLKTQDASEMSTLFCTTSTTCVGVGIYLENSIGIAQPIVFSETKGVWATPVEAPGSASFNPNGLAVVDLLACPSTSTCVASGVILMLSPLSIEPFLITENNGAWASPEAVPGMSALSRQSIAVVESLSCGAPGDCTAVGEYTDAVGGSQAFVINEVAGAWGSASQLFATQLLGSGLNNALTGVACLSAGNCTAIGSFADAQGNLQPFVVDESNHAWSPAVALPGMQALNKGDGAYPTTIACSALGACSAGGTYSDASRNAQVFVVNEKDSSWSTPMEIPGTSSLNKGGTADVSEVSCSADGSCGVQGTYTDANNNTQLFVVNSSAVAPTTVSSPPRHVTALDRSGVITVHWNAPVSNGGTAITSYTVASSPATRPCVTHATSCSFKGLNKKVNYRFAVRATNANGSSALSAKSNVVRDA